MCPSERRPVVCTVGALGLGAGDKPGYQGRAEGGGPLFHLPPTIKGMAGLSQGRVSGHKGSGGARGLSGGGDKSVFLRVPSQQMSRGDKVMGSGGQTVDLSPHGFAAICHGCRLRPGAREGSSATQRR